MGVRPPLTTVALVALAVFLGASFLRTFQEEKPPKKEPAAVPLVIPDEEKNRKNPIEATAESVATGRKLFGTQCTMCHGEKGDGQGDLAQELKLTMPDFSDAEGQKKRTDGELHYILTEGHGRMPGQGTRLRAEQKWHMINFIRSLARKEEKK